MNTTVLKYTLNKKVLMPKGAQILHIEAQHVSDNFQIWALIDKDNPMEERVFQMVETGKDIIDNNLLIKVKHIKTLLIEDESYVLHVFENVKI